MFATAAINFLPAYWLEEDVTVLWFETEDGQQLSDRLWIAENDFTNQNNAMYYVSIGGIDFTGTIIDDEVSTGDIAEAHSIRVFPNPVREEQLQVQFSGVTDQSLNWSLFNTEGRMIKAEKFDVSVSEIQTIDVTSLQPGLYILQINGDKLFYREKVVIINR